MSVPNDNDNSTSDQTEHTVNGANTDRKTFNCCSTVQAVLILALVSCLLRVLNHNETGWYTTLQSELHRITSVNVQSPDDFANCDRHISNLRLRTDKLISKLILFVFKLRNHTVNQIFEFDDIFRLMCNPATKKLCTWNSTTQLHKFHDTLKTVTNILFASQEIRRSYENEVNGQIDVRVQCENCNFDEISSIELSPWTECESLDTRRSWTLNGVYAQSLSCLLTDPKYRQKIKQCGCTASKASIQIKKLPQYSVTQLTRLEYVDDDGYTCYQNRFVKDWTPVQHGDDIMVPIGKV